jgi:hypothetical protein
LARGYQVLGDRRYLEAAQACATFLQRELWVEGRLLRVWRRGRAHTAGFLEDHAALLEGLVDLFEADFQPRWLTWAESLGEALLANFQDGAEGGFYSTEAGQADLLFRQKPGFDNAIPGGNTLAARSLLRLSRHLQRADFRTAAEGTLRCFGPRMQSAPRAFLGMLGILDQVLREPLNIALSGQPADPAVRTMLAEVHRRYLPGRVLSVSPEQLLPLHEGRATKGGQAVAFVCRGRTCAPPVKSAQDLGRLLQTAVI